MKELVFEVNAGTHERRWTPVSAEVESDVLGGSESWTLVDDRGLEYPVQIDRSGSSARVVWIVPRQAAGSVRRFTLRAGAKASAGGAGAPGVALAQESDGKVVVRIGGKHFTTYHYGAELPRPFLYPFIGPAGVSVTRHFPMRADVEGEKHDHPHHRSVWFTHGDVNGADNWSEKQGHARTLHTAFDRLESGEVFGEIATRNRWVTGAGEHILDQDLTLRFYALPDHIRLMDATLTFHATEQDVTFGDTKEGGLFAVRVATTMDASGFGTIETGSGAIGEGQAWGQPAPWCHYSGPVRTEFGPVVAGIAILDHPSNPRYPTHWHVRAYGLMTANPFGHSHYYRDKSRNGSMTIPKGQSATFRYRAVVHEGSAADGHISDHFASFAHPPQVTRVP